MIQCVSGVVIGARGHSLPWSSTVCSIAEYKFHDFKFVPCPVSRDVIHRPAHERLVSYLIKWVADIPNLQVRGLDNGIPVVVPALGDARDIRSDPSAVEVTWLRLDLLSIDEAVPGSGVEGKISLDRYEPARWVIVGPDAVRCSHSGRGRRDLVVCCCALPLAPGLPTCLCQGQFEGRRWKVVGCTRGASRVSKWSYHACYALRLLIG